MKGSSNEELRRDHFGILPQITKIHEALVSHPPPTLAKLAELLGCSARNVKRYLQKMRLYLGAPIIYDSQRSGYRYLEPGWKFPHFEFSEGEMLAFFLAERVLKHAGHTPEAMLLRSALSKLAARLPEKITLNPTALGEAVSFEQNPHVLAAPAHLNFLAKAAVEQRTLEIVYHTQSRNQTTSRKIDVLHLHNFAGDWYAIAFDHFRQEPRDFHVGRIKSIRETQDFFEPPPKWDANEYLRGGFGMMRGGRQTQVSIVFDSYQARYMRERHSFHPDELRTELPDGSLRLTFPVGRNGLDAVARFCLTYIGHCMVEQPPALRELVRQRLQTGMKQHEGD